MDTNRTTIFTTLFGSRLYGLATPTSDYDYKAVYMPTVDELITGSADLTSSNHTIKDEKDTENMSIHKFFSLAKQGQTMAIDMLFSNKYEALPIWNNFVLSNREKFITKNMNAFMGYAKSQAIKYSNRGKNLNNLKNTYEILSNYFLDHAKFSDALVNRIFNDNVKYEMTKDKNGISMVSINGIQFHTDVVVKFVKETIKKHMLSYGTRANDACDNEGSDYKAISHAFRVIYECEELATTGKLEFPLKKRDFIYAVKTGCVNLNPDEVIDYLKSEMERVDTVLKNSELPEKCDVDTRKIILNMYHN